MKLKLELEVEVDDTNGPRNLEDALADALAMMHWTFCNEGSDKQITKLCAEMSARGDYETTAEDSGNMGWTAAIKIER